MELGISFRSASTLSRNIMDMGPSVFASPLSFQQTSIGDKFYETLTAGKPQVEIPIVHKNTVDVAKTANMQQNALTNTGSLRGQVNQAKSAFKETMEAAKTEARQAIMESAQEMGMNAGHVAAAIFPGKPSDAVNLAMALDPLFATAIWSAVNDAISQVPNSKVAELLDKAMGKLHESARPQPGGQPPKAAFNWDKFEAPDLRNFLKADPLKDDFTGRQILAVEQSVIEMERNQKNLEANYTCTGDVYEKAKNELDIALAAQMIDIKKCAAECEILAEALPAIKGVVLKKEETPVFESVEEVKKKLAEAAPKPEPKPELKQEPAMLERLMDPLARLNPFRTAA